MVSNGAKCSIQVGHAPERKKLNLLAIAGQLLEHLFLAISLFMLIPPIESNEEKYDAQGQIILMLPFLFVSRFIAIRQGRETWFGVLLKAGIFIALGYAINLRIY